jgi:hypothetical protein
MKYAKTGLEIDVIDYWLIPSDRLKQIKLNR